MWLGPFGFLLELLGFSIGVLDSLWFLVGYAWVLVGFVHSCWSYCWTVGLKKLQRTKQKKASLALPNI